MTVKELAVLYALNGTQKPGGESGWHPVSAADLSAYIRRGMKRGGDDRATGITGPILALDPNWKPSPRQVASTLRKLGEERSGTPLVEVEGTHPRRYRMTRPGVRVLCT